LNWTLHLILIIRAKAEKRRTIADDFDGFVMSIGLSITNGLRFPL
jgi:hypothetical protein